MIQSSLSAHLVTLATILVLDFTWLWVTGRLEPYLQNNETIMFALLARCLMFAWVMYTVIPAILCDDDRSLQHILQMCAIKAAVVFGMLNFSMVMSFDDAAMPLLDTFWAMVLTCTAAITCLYWDYKEFLPL